MTGLELMAQYAARENAAMRANLGYTPYRVKPGKTPRYDEGIEDWRATMMKIIKARPGLTRDQYMFALQCSEARWKAGIGGLLASGQVLMTRRMNGTKVQYFPGDVQ